MAMVQARKYHRSNSCERNDNQFYIIGRHDTLNDLPDAEYKKLCDPDWNHTLNNEFIDCIIDNVANNIPAYAAIESNPNVVGIQSMLEYDLRRNLANDKTCVFIKELSSLIQQQLYFSVHDTSTQGKMILLISNAKQENSDVTDQVIAAVTMAQNRVNLSTLKREIQESTC
jgi:hypothetical protein